MSRRPQPNDFTISGVKFTCGHLGLRECRRDCEAAHARPQIKQALTFE